MDVPSLPADDADYELLQREIQRFATRLKRELDLEDMFNEVLYEKEVALTPSCQTVIALVIIEAAQAQRERHQMGVYDASLDVDPYDLRRSFEAIIDEIKDDPAERDVSPVDKRIVDKGRSYPFRSVLSLLKAIHERWCKIPPFC